MKTNVPLLSSLRKPFRSSLLLILFGLISFGFMTKAVGYILIQRETGVLGSYYRSIGTLENVNDSTHWWCNPSKSACINVKDPQSGDVSAGINLIKASPLIAYSDQRQIVSGVMPQTYNENRIDSNDPMLMEALPPEYWPNTHTYDLWFAGDLVAKEEVKTWAKLPEDQKTVGYYLKFHIDTLLAAHPEYARQGDSVALLFIFQGREAAIPSIQAMQAGQRYFIRGRDDHNHAIDLTWVNAHYAYLEIKPLDDGQLWYIPLAQGAGIDFSDPLLAPFKNEIDVLNENLHTLTIITSADQSAMPKMQESSRFYYLTEGRWLNHQDDLAGNKVIVLPEPFANLRWFKVGDEITFTFRPLTDTYFGLIRDGVDSLNWKSYPTYQDTFKVVGLYNDTNNWAFSAYIPASSLRPGFASVTQNQFRYEEYNFVLDSSRHEAEFIQEFKDPLQALGIRLNFLPNNGPAFWAAVDPIQRSSSADLLVFSLLMVVALILAVFLYVMARKRDYAILRALGVPKKQSNGQLLLPLLLLGGLGITLGGLPAWNYALTQAKASLSTLPTPAGVSPSADLSPLILAGLCIAIFLFLALFSWLGVNLLAHKPVYELLQGETSQNIANQKRKRTNASSQPIPSLSSGQAGALDLPGITRQGPAANQVDLAARRKYTPSSLSGYVLHHVLRSRLRSVLTLAVALGFLLASAWIRQTMERSRLEVERLYDTTVVEADIVPADPSSTEDMPGGGTGFVYQQTIDSVLNSGFVQSSVLEADTAWVKIKNLVSKDVFPGNFSVYAYDSPEAFHTGLADPGSLVFASGWDMNLFAQTRTIEEIRKNGLPVLFPLSMLEMLQLKVGQTVQITVQSSSTYPCIIVGQYSGGRAAASYSNSIPWKNGPINPILIPLSALESMDGSQTRFTVAHFSLDPKRNRELPQLHADMEKVMQGLGGKLNFVIWDEELRIVVAQLDKNLSLLKVLYPVVIGVSVLIGAGLCFLLLLQATREAAILRVLGTTRTAVRLALIIEPLILSILGGLLGLGISRLLWMSSDLLSLIPLLIGAGLYLAGVLAGSVTGAISVTNKKPIELLQVKE
jgi:ABC-type antimicrobial peptide transport system permease subunit